MNTSISEELIKNRRIVMVTGKGGIGKTLVATSLAHLAASQGIRVCLMESRIDDQLAPLLGLEPVGHKLVEISQNLSIMNLNAHANFRDFIVKHLGYERLFERVFNTTMVQSFIRMLPGVAELTLLGRLFYMAELYKEKFDLVIFDGFASGHFLNLLTTPQAIMDSGLVGPVVHETKRVIDFFNAPGVSAIVQVATAEELVLSELRDFMPKISAAGFSQLNTVFLNRYVDDTKLPAAIAFPWKDCLSYTQSKYAHYHERVLNLKSWMVAQKSHSAFLRTLPDLGIVDEPWTSARALEFLDSSERL